MRLETIYDIQRTLNERIVREHDLYKEDLKDKKVLALLTELGELANETRVFKYWSSKGPSPDSVILEEYVDCLHFILTLGIDFDFENEIPSEIEADDRELSAQFVELFTIVTSLSGDPKADIYKNLLEEFLYLGRKLGFSQEMIENAYLEKNKINHKRQDTNY